MKRLALIHTVAAVIPAFRELCDELLTDTKVVDLVDESILLDVIERGGLDADINRRVAALVIQAQAGGADAIMLTCSSISPCADIAAPLVSAPVLKVDEPMARAAVREGGTIGVAATLPTTLNPTVSLLRACAAKAPKRVRIRAQLCAGAFEALVSGDRATHDRLVLEGVQHLLKTTHNVVLAQASMAKALADAGLPRSARIRTSPRLAVRNAARVLRGAVRRGTRNRRDRS